MRAAVESLAIDHAASTTATRVTISLGISTMVPTETGSSEALVAAADGALYESKHAGRNRVSFRAATAGTKVRRPVP
jgi:diguanylate cyclase (GGDEF)-like protein